MQQAIHAIEIDKCAEVGDVFSRLPTTRSPTFTPSMNFCRFSLRFLLNYFTPAENDVFCGSSLSFNDFEIVRVANELL